MVSSAVRPTNVEIVEARRRGIPVILRGEMLAEIMRPRFGIAVAGAHGKTTTSSMIAVMLAHAGLDPTAIIGARVPAFDSNARVGRGEYLVAEADESDRSFLKLMACMTVVTNIDYEHLERYAGFDDLTRRVRGVRQQAAVLRRVGALHRRRPRADHRPACDRAAS